MKKNQTWAECSWINQHMNDVFFFLFPPGFLSAGFCMIDAPTSRRREVQSLFRVHLTVDEEISKSTNYDRNE